MVNGRNKISNCFNNELLEAFAKCYKNTTVTVPVNTRKNDSSFNNEIVKIRENLAGMCNKLRINDTILMRQKINSEKERLSKLINRAVQHSFELRMRANQDKEKVNLRDFWSYTGQFVNKSSYQTRVDKMMSKEKTMEKLDKIESTFFNPDPDTLLE